MKPFVAPTGTALESQERTGSFGKPGRDTPAARSDSITNDFDFPCRAKSGTASAGATPPGHNAPGHRSLPLGRTRAASPISEGRRGGFPAASPLWRSCSRSFGCRHRRCEGCWRRHPAPAQRPASPMPCLQACLSLCLLGFHLIYFCCPAMSLIPSPRVPFRPPHRQAGGRALVFAFRGSARRHVPTAGSRKLV